MNVLVVEDHSDTRSALERLLSRWGHNVNTAADVRAGLELLKTRPFDAIVSDIALPDGSGYALMSAARRQGFKALAIAISAYPYPYDIYEPLITGFDHHLSKPFKAGQLQRVLEKHEREDETEELLIG
jgi:CheY-like chemotaxis protein